MYPTITNLDAVIDYQKNLVILPSYRADVGKSFPTDHDWPAYFKQTNGRTGSDLLPEPEKVAGAVIEVSDKTCGERSRTASAYMVHPIDWDSDDEQDRWVGWVQRTVLGRSSAGMNNYQELRLQVASLTKAG